MTVRELVFEYKTRGAAASAKADKRVRQSVQRTGKAAQRNAGSVERWLQRSRKAISMLAKATLGAVGAILAASPTMRAELSGVRAAFTLFADTIVRDLLPGTGSLSTKAIELAQAFRDLDKPTRKIVGGLILLAALVSGVALAFGVTAGLIVGAAVVVSYAVYKLLKRFGALEYVVSAFKNAGRALVALLQGDFSGALQYAKLAVFNLLLAFLKVKEGVKRVISSIVEKVKGVLVRKFNEAKTRLAEIATSIYLAIAQKFNDLKLRLREIATGIRDWVVEKFTELKKRVLSILSLGRQFSDKAKKWIGGLIQGVKDRVSDLVSAFRDMATQAANAFRAAFNRIIPDSVSIPRVSISVPDILGGGSIGIGGGSISIPQLATGGRIAQDGLAMLHAGERVVPAAQVRERGPQPVGGGTTVENVEITVQAMGDDARMTGRNIAKEFQRELEDRGA